MSIFAGGVEEWRKMSRVKCDVFLNFDNFDARTTFVFCQSLCSTTLCVRAIFVVAVIFLLWIMRCLVSFRPEAFSLFSSIHLFVYFVEA